MLCDNCHQRLATITATKNKEPLIGMMDPAKKHAQLIIQICEVCAEQWPANAKRPT